MPDAVALETRAILDLKAKGWAEGDILRLLGISRATLFRRLARSREIKRRHRPPQMAILSPAVAC